MFVGHYSVSIAARTAQPSIPLWVWVVAAQLLDIVWSLFVIAGLERVRAAPHVTEGLAFVHYPWSHSLAAAFVWGGLTTQVARRVFGAAPRAATLLGFVVVSHWLFDLVVHRPDLEIAPGVGPELGLGLWDHPGPELLLEVVLFLAAGALLLRSWRAEGRRLWPLAAFLVFAAAAFVAMRQAPPPTDIEPGMLGIAGLLLYGLFTLLAWLVERLSPRPAR